MTHWPQKSVNSSWSPESYLSSSAWDKLNPVWSEILKTSQINAQATENTAVALVGSDVWGNIVNSPAQQAQLATLLVEEESLSAGTAPPSDADLANLMSAILQKVQEDKTGSHAKKLVMLYDTLTVEQQGEWAKQVFQQVVQNNATNFDQMWSDDRMLTSITAYIASLPPPSGGGSSSGGSSNGGQTPKPPTGSPIGIGVALIIIAAFLFLSAKYKP